MYDQLFCFADAESLEEFRNILNDEELWYNTHRNNNSVTVISIFESTAKYLYDQIKEKGLRVLN